MVPQSLRQAFTLLNRVFRLAGRRIGLADINRGFAAPYGRIFGEIAVIVKRVDAGPVNPLDVRQWCTLLRNHRQSDKSANDGGISGVENKPGLPDRVQVLQKPRQLAHNLPDIAFQPFSGLRLRCLLGYLGPQNFHLALDLIDNHGDLILLWRCHEQIASSI